MTDRVLTEVGQRLKSAREHAGISANALSVAMDPCPGRAWAGWVESGEITDPSVDALKRAAKVLGVREEWLILGAGEMLHVGDSAPNTERLVDFADLPSETTQVIHYQDQGHEQ